MNLDRTFCMSPECKSECGRQWTKEHEAAATRCGKGRISMAYFCGEPDTTLATGDQPGDRE